MVAALYGLADPPGTAQDGSHVPTGTATRVDGHAPAHSTVICVMPDGRVVTMVCWSDGEWSARDGFADRWSSEEHPGEPVR
ncbi:hypothetical protein [Streptomyces sp. MMBL 11-3]|uniref:hypothetical protein n=1 Tax=Streptomyces sp. MMBL 11-3 TaxID=3382639 RepID=UPI0039B44E2C